jgi:hypothetical protein
MREPGAFLPGTHKCKTLCLKRASNEPAYGYDSYKTKGRRGTVFAFIFGTCYGHSDLLILLNSRGQHLGSRLDTSFALVASWPYCIKVDVAETVKSKAEHANCRCGRGSSLSCWAIPKLWVWSTGGWLDRHEQGQASGGPAGNNREKNRQLTNKE